MAQLFLRIVTLQLLLSSFALGFAIYQPEKLDVTLGEGCIDALSANINCADYVRSFMLLSYRGSLNNTTLTDTICTSDCLQSLKSWFDSVASKCSGKTLNDAIPMKFGGYMWAGFNETCIKDPKTKQYCNDVIDKFTDVDSITKMPKTELCSTCNVRRLTIMQSSQYSIYDSVYKSELEYINSECGLKNPTDIPPPLTVAQPAPAPYCLTGKRYTTQKGDTCDSIASSAGVSGAALYMGNRALIPDCSNAIPGATLCIPLPCQTYRVSKNDTCTSIESALKLDRDSLRNYNSWLTFGCTNLQPATDFYGKTICVSPQGGTFTGTAPPPVPSSNPELADGHTKAPTPPPQGVTVAPGTTLNCGKWHIVESADTCSAICVQNSITAQLFRQVNPSLKENCDTSLQPQTAICVGPTYSWNSTLPETTSASTGMPTATGSMSATKATSLATAKVSATASASAPHRQARNAHRHHMHRHNG